MKMQEICDSFGGGFDTFTPRFHKLLAVSNLDYDFITGPERDKVILQSLKHIKDDTQSIGADCRTEEWRKGWQENLDAYKRSNSLDSIVPKFIRPNRFLRFRQDFIQPANEYFERDYCKLFQIWLFETYMAPYDTIYEFGCGSGFNLVCMADLFPDKCLVGTDFVDSSVNLINKIAETQGCNMSGYLFDMITPNLDFKLEDNSCVLTFGALEQLAGKSESFIEYLIAQKVGLCVHVEPTIELYNPDNIVDYLAIQFHLKRGYSTGLLPFLRKKEERGEIDIKKVKRLYFGNHRMEGYTYMAWSPK